jgi:acyl carrier protein
MQLKICRVCAKGAKSILCRFSGGVRKAFWGVPWRFGLSERVARGVPPERTPQCREARGEIGSVNSIESFIQNFNTAVDFQTVVEFRSDTLLTDLPEWDSLAALAVIVMFDMEYNVIITGEDLKQCKRVEDIHKLLDRKS